MEQQHQSLSEQQVKTQQKTTEKQAEQPQCCPNCGTPCHSGDKFCEECGMPLKGKSCVRCGVPIQADWEICPHCGQSLHAELCSFCGASMEADDSFCPDCGNPRTGIICPDCNTLNFRSFCRKCNRPLNEMAMQEMQKAKHDPVFQEMLALAQELADLEERILDTPSGEISEEDSEPPQLELSEADKKLIQQYKDLFSGSGSLEEISIPKPKPLKETPVQARPKIQLNVKRVDLDEAKQLYKEKLEEMRGLMEKLRPEGDMTPQMQRNYYSARKLPVLRKSVSKAPVCWVCNLCGCQHNQPSECAQPELGGTWIYEDVVTVTKTFEYQDD
ncbi:zinc ribbon domain-containing protein [uncultured Bacteroides sp.]|uniref:zinc ribbon domain-containing protein n=1 Tax=uncultured Bacteroides sp. TaxID=162156 RepID=UPI00258D19DE|nr:zinc ribbon domain-containing protein [uncultured Bacteroides sp.]